MYMMLILNVLVVHLIGLNSVGEVTSAKEEQEFRLELTGEVRDSLTSFGTEKHDFAHMRLGSAMSLHS